MMKPESKKNLHRHPEKPSLSRLENSAAYNSTLQTLHRYATAIGLSLEHVLMGGSDIQARAC